MFSSNQKFDVTCAPADLPKVIAFALSLYGDDMFTRGEAPVQVAWSEPCDGIYAIGRGSMTGASWCGDIPCGKGWTDYGFPYDPVRVADAVSRWAASRPDPEPNRPGYRPERGIRVRSMESIGPDLPPPYEMVGWSWPETLLMFTPRRLDKGGPAAPDKKEG